MSETGEVRIDGSEGEGGGQVLRTAISLSMVTGRPLRIVRLRAGRERPGLRPQHLAAVRAAAEVCGARLEGDRPGSQDLSFVPGPVRGGDLRVSVGTAGSAVLVLQTLVPPLLVLDRPSSLEVEGGTHNPLAPPWEFLERAWLPVLGRMGARVHGRLERVGFAPAGGGRVSLRVDPVPRLEPVELTERGEVRSVRARALLVGLPPPIAERELRVVRRILGWEPRHCTVEEPAGARGVGNVLLLEIECEHATEVFVGFGEKGVRAEAVAERAAHEAKRWLDADVPVGEHLADQLLLPFALAGGGRFATLSLSSHAVTNVDVIRRFLPVEVEVSPAGRGRVEVAVRAR